MLFVMLVWIVLEASPLTSGADYQCGRSVEYSVPYTPLCLHHNTTVPTPVTAILGRVSTRLQLVPGQPMELHPSIRDSTLSLKSPKTVCYFLSKQGCKVAEEKEGGREIRSAYTMDKEQVNHSPPSHEVLLLHVALPAVALLLLSPLVMAAFLCCPGGSNTKQTFSRTFSKKDKRKGLSASTDISINITDSDHPLGSDHFTTFHKEVQESHHANQRVPSPVALGRPSRTRSEPSLLDQLSPQGMLGSAPHLLESSLDIGTRPDSYQEGQCLGTSVSSIHSLGPRVPPEGSSLGNLTSIEKLPPYLTRTPSPHHSPGMPPPPRIPPPSSNAHIRQNSTPISVPPPPSPLQKPRPLTVIGKPSDHDSITVPRCSIPPLPPKPHPLLSSPPLSPVSLSESEALGPVRPGRVNPYRVVHQPSPSLTSLPDLPHTSDGSLCIQCGARVSGSTVLEPAEETTSEEEPHSAAPSDELCQQCLVTDPHYQELNSPSDEDGPSNDGNTSLLPDPVYERIGSIRRHHIVTPPTSHGHHIVTPPTSHGHHIVTPPTSHGYTSDDRSQPTSRPPAPSPPSSAKLESSLQTVMSSSLSFSHLPKCPLPSEGAPLPPRPPIMKLLKGDSTESNHDYESLPSTFDQSPDTTYARITSPEEGRETTPPYVPENSQRAQMLKIDSQGYAEVVSKAEGEPLTPDPDPGYSPCFPLSPSRGQAVASDYEVPVRITSLPGSSPLHLQPATTQLSPSPFQSSPTHSPTTPIPVPSPVPPSSTPCTLPPSSTKPTAPAPLKRQGAVTDNTVTVARRSMQVVPMEDRQSLEDRRDSTQSAASYHLTFRFSTASSTLGESMSDSLLAIPEEGTEQADQTSRGGEVKEQRQLTALECDDQRTADKIGKKDKIYEVENRSRTNSYPVRVGNQPGVDVASHKHKAQTMRMLISFNKDSKAV